jgi:hypothetical protein
MHRHRPNVTIDRSFRGPVNNERRRPEADGNITRVARCACGAERQTNINGAHREIGVWSIREAP